MKYLCFAELAADIEVVEAWQPIQNGLEKLRRLEDQLSKGRVITPNMT